MVQDIDLPEQKEENKGNVQWKKKVSKDFTWETVNIYGTHCKGCITTVMVNQLGYL